MFVNIKKYFEGTHSHNTEMVGNKVLVYPENKLPDLVVTSDFGDCTVCCSDLYDLFNQQRISNLGPDVIRDFIARNYPVNSPISEQISKMSDSDILDSIKPRHVQSYSELMHWSRYLNERIENGLQSVVDVNNSPSDPPVTSDPPAISDPSKSE